MIEPVRQDVPIAEIDLSDTRLKFRGNFKEDAIKALAENIQRMSLLNAVKLWKQDGRYTVIAGRRRIAAVASLGWGRISADVYEGITYEEALRINIADNNLREDLSDYEIACQMQTLRQRDHYSAEMLAELFGCGVDRVYDLLSVAGMDAELRGVLERGELQLYKVVILNRFPPSERSKILEKALLDGLSVMRIRQELAKLKSSPPCDGCLPVDAGPKEVRNALRIPQGKAFPDRRRAFWEILRRHGVLQGPTRFRLIMSAAAQGCDPPLVCDQDAEWVHLIRVPQGGDHGFNGEEVPSKEGGVQV